jgi:transposase InsO family protein
MSQANPLWGAPRIHGELRKLGIAVSQSSVAKYIVRRPVPPSQTWRTFLANHVEQIMAADFFVVPTVTYRLLFVLVILAHDRRRVVHVAVTEHPTSAWTAQQLRNAFPDDERPPYLLHDRDASFIGISATIAAMQIQDVVTAARSPWQNAYVERFIGSIRRECLDHVIVLGAAGLQRVVNDYFAYYMRSRTHLSLDKDSPMSRPVMPPSAGRRRGSSGQRSAPSLRPRGRIARRPHAPSLQSNVFRSQDTTIVRALWLLAWLRSRTSGVDSRCATEAPGVLPCHSASSTSDRVFGNDTHGFTWNGGHPPNFTGCIGLTAEIAV